MIQLYHKATNAYLFINRNGAVMTTNKDNEPGCKHFLCQFERSYNMVGYALNKSSNPYEMALLGSIGLLLVNPLQNKSSTIEITIAIVHDWYSVHAVVDECSKPGGEVVDQCSKPPFFYLPAFFQVVDRGLGVISLEAVKFPNLRLRMDRNGLTGKVCGIDWIPVSVY